MYSDFTNIFTTDLVNSVNNILTSCMLHHTFLNFMILTENCMNLHLMYRILYNTYKDSPQSYTKYNKIRGSGDLH